MKSPKIILRHLAHLGRVLLQSGDCLTRRVGGACAGIKVRSMPGIVRSLQCGGATGCRRVFGARVILFAVMHCVRKPACVFCCLGKEKSLGRQMLSRLFIERKDLFWYKMHTSQVFVQWYGKMKRCTPVNRQGRGAAFAIRHKDQFNVEVFISSAISHRLFVIRISTFRFNNSPNKSVSTYFFFGYCVVVAT